MSRLANPLLALPLLAVLAAGCNQAGPPVVPPLAEATEAVLVKAAKPRRETLHRSIEQPGTVRADEEAPLFAKLPGFVRKVYVDIDQEVKGPVLDDKGTTLTPGTLLAEVDLPETVAELSYKEALAAQAELDVEHARKTVTVVDASVTAGAAAAEEMRAGLRRTESNYERRESELQRARDLVKKEVINKGVLDETLDEFRSAEAARGEMRAKVDSAVAALAKVGAERQLADIGVRQAEARLKAARAEVKRLEALVRYGEIRAPFDGVVTRRRVDAGAFLQPMNGVTAEPILVVARQDPVRVFVEVTELDAALVKKGVKCKVRFQSLGNREVAGEVTRTAWALNPTTRTLLTEIDLPNPDKKLRPGMYVYARIEANLPGRLVLPATAVQKQGDATVCYRIADGKAVRTPVQLGVADGPWVEVLKVRKPGMPEQWADFTEDGEYVADNLASVTDGRAVRTGD